MKGRLAIAFAVAGIALAAAAAASADPNPNPPTQDLPNQGDSFPAGSQITFQAKTPAIIDPAPNLDFYISSSPDTNSRGVLFRGVDIVDGDHVSGNPPIDPAVYTASWSSVPATYYWQAVYIDCTQDPDCFNESLKNSFTINPRPASSVSVANPPDTFLTDHPRRRVHQRKARFAFSSDVAGANFQCLYAKGWAACKSPHIFRHLEPGRFRFQTRAIVNGVEDPDPASWVFKVLH
jgi:hypothetical protein